MSFLFKSKKAREREERRDRRKAFRQAENAIDGVKDRLKSMDREATKQWEAAREAMKAGEKEKARRLLTGYRATQVMLTKLEQKRWVFEQYLTKMEVARTDNEFASALAQVNKVTLIDPEAVADVFETSRELLDEQLDTERFWNRLYEKESGSAASNLESHLPSMEELEQQITQEAALETGQGSAPTDQALNERLGEARQRIDKILGKEGD